MSKNSILGDHIRYKTKFLPPLAVKLNIREISWKRQILPELLWITLLNNAYGIKEGVKLTKEFTKICADYCTLNPKPLIASVTSFNILNIKQKTQILNTLYERESYMRLMQPLGCLLAYYPQIPLSFLAPEDIELNAYKTQQELEILKNVVQTLFDRTAKDTIFTQATFFYLGFSQGKVRIFKDSTLAKFSEVENYPYTELSRIIASLIRATILSMFDPKPDSHQWPQYFWDRGIEITPCT